jgi:hypothetical protein
MGLEQQRIILSSRCFRKCVQEIKLLPKKEAARLIEKHLDEALAAWTAAYESGESPSFLSDGKDGTPVLRGMRYKVLALILIAGTCELTDCQAAIRKVANVALEQKKNIPPEYNSSFLEWCFLAEVSLWNPMILSAGLYGTHPQKNAPEFKDITERYAEHQIVDYTAKRNEYEGRGRTSRAVEPDKEYIQIRYFEKATDEDVLLLLGVPAK